MDEVDSVNLYSKIKFLEFVENRAKSTDFRAAQKLKAIEELADCIFTAREYYRNKTGK